MYKDRAYFFFWMAQGDHSSALTVLVPIKGRILFDLELVATGNEPELQNNVRLTCNSQYKR
jgi:hypothetical protein